MTLGRWVGLTVLVLFGIYALRGGEFTTTGYRQLEEQEAAAKIELRRLRDEVKRMRAFKDSLETDKGVQERVAREQWGMVRPGELMILLGGRDSTK